MEQEILQSNIVYDPNLIWKAMRTALENPEAERICKKCGKKYLIHVHYSNVGITACIGLGKCDKIEEVIRNMLKLRGFTFIKLIKVDLKRVIEYICNHGHQYRINYESLRKGGCCLICFNKSREIPKKEKKKLIRTVCACVGWSDKNKPHFCPHHNHGICHPDSSKEWDFDLNENLLPTQISPQSKTEYWWKCSNEWCQMPYQQNTNTRISQDSRCPYCAGRKTCEWNCLSTTHPELIEEWDFVNNKIKPDEITHGSRTIVSWICREHDIPHRWDASVGARSDGSGCSKCNDPGYEQLVGGHEFFVKKANEIHNKKYQYPEEYKGTKVKINIYCPALDKNNNAHGNFLQRPDDHKRGQGCPKCAVWYDQLVGGHEHFIEKANKIHNGKYQYPEEYIASDIKIKIICPILEKDNVAHGEFQQTPGEHKAGFGCPKCSKEKHESKGIKQLKEMLEILGYKENVHFFLEQELDGLIYKRSLRLDICIPIRDLVIEFDGQQHFEISEPRGGKVVLEINKLRDLEKDKYCMEKGLNLLRIPYTFPLTIDFLGEMLELCKSGKHLYVTYSEYHRETEKKVDLSKIHYIRMKV